jgi:hypothetical protein
MNAPQAIIPRWIGIDHGERPLLGERHCRLFGDLLVLLFPFGFGFCCAFDALFDVVASFRHHFLKLLFGHLPNDIDAREQVLIDAVVGEGRLKNWRFNLNTASFSLLAAPRPSLCQLPPCSPRLRPRLLQIIETALGTFAYLEGVSL